MRDEMQQAVSQALAQAVNPAILCSFGKDSLLLLDLALNAGYDGPIYHFGDVSKFGQQVIMDRNLTCYSWPATNRYVVPDGDGLAQVDEYLLGKVLIPLVSEVVESDECSHGVYQRFARPFKYPHDVTLTGYKRGEEVAGQQFVAMVDIGVTQLVHPLYEFSDDEVIDALGYEPPDTNSATYCCECLSTLKASDLDSALAMFNQRFQFN